MTENRVLKILFVEDNPYDVELAIHELHKENLKFVTETVCTRNDFIRSLGAFNPDIIISDYLMPEYTGLQALKDLKLHDESLPFILCTGSVNESTAVECIKAGAVDYIIKEHMTRLPFAVKEALVQAKIKKDKRIAEQLLRESEERLQNIYNDSIVCLYRTNPKGEILIANQTLIKMLGFSSFEELASRNLQDSGYGESSPRQEFLNQIEKYGEVKETEAVWISKEGKEIFVRESAKAIYDKDGKILFIDGTVADITEKKIAEKALDETNRTINTLIGNLQGIVYRCRNDKDWTMEYLSNGTTELTGYLPEELLHNNVISFNNIIHNEDRDFIQSEVQIALKNKEHFHCTYRIVTRSGEVKWVWEKGEGIFDENGRLEHLEGFITDISQRKILEEEKMQGEQRYRELFLNNPVPTYIFDEDTLEFIEVNDATVQNYGYSREEFATMTIKDVRVPDDIPELIESMESMKKNNIAIFMSSHFRHKKKNGVVFPVDITSHSLPEKDGRKTRLVTAIDITERVNASEQMRLAKEKAEASDRLKTMFLNNISHEVRTPLNGILGFAGIISQEILSDKDRVESLRMLQESSDRLLATITNYMDISLITSGNMSVYKRDFSPKEILSSLFNNYKTLCAAKGLELLLELPVDSENIIVNNDPEVLKKIFSHLLNNAVKFTDQGTVRYGYCFRNRELEFFVKDSGIGIEKESLDIIFDNFVKEDHSPSKLTEGSGLGLSISKGFADILGGSIRVESEPGSGSSFYFSIPSEIKSGAIDKGFPTVEHGNSKGVVTVLVAEDDETNFLYLKAVLTREVKALVLHASNGIEVIELFKSHPEVSLIFMDIKMPEIDGLEATRQIKLLNNSIPIIAITAYAMSGDEDRVLAAGCDCYMSKPFSKKALLDKIAEYVKF